MLKHENLSILRKRSIVTSTSDFRAFHLSPISPVYIARSCPLLSLQKAFLPASLIISLLFPTGGLAVVCSVAAADHHLSAHSPASRPFSALIKVQDLRRQHYCNSLCLARGHQALSVKVTHSHLVFFLTKRSHILPTFRPLSFIPDSEGADSHNQ